MGFLKMLSKECFKNNFVGACVAKGLAPAEKQSLVFLYDVVKDEFTDEEFTAITKDVVLNENFYGKIPDISLWVCRKKKETKNDAEAKFIDKFCDYIYADYVSLRQKEDFSKNLTPSEMNALNSIGGISSLRSSCRKNGVFVDEKSQWAVDRAKKAFNQHYSESLDNTPMIEESKNEEMILKIENLTKGMFK